MNRAIFLVKNQTYLHDPCTRKQREVRLVQHLIIFSAATVGALEHNMSRRLTIIFLNLVCPGRPAGGIDVLAQIPGYKNLV